MLPSMNRPCRPALGAVAIIIGLLLSGCGSSSTQAASSSKRSASASRPDAGPPRHRGEVIVLSAGSLDTVLTGDIGPAFHARTGYTLLDTSGGSSSLAADIRNGVDRADVFISAAPSIDTRLEGARNGNWISWYATFAASPYVLAYYPDSRFAAALRRRAWYRVITMPGFRLGRTNPAQDPGGILASEALLETAAARHIPALRRLAAEGSDEYQEDSEQAGVLSGQLDASFMYEADANSQHSPFVALTGVHLAGDYTVTLLRGAPDREAAIAFIRFLVGPLAKRALRADHFLIVAPPKVDGRGVPGSLEPALSR
jgi:molybdate/tungstate transport system substrate-binding protein